MARAVFRSYRLHSVHRDDRTFRSLRAHARRFPVAPAGRSAPRRRPEPHDRVCTCQHGVPLLKPRKLQRAILFVMTKDYFQDIIPPEKTPHSSAPIKIGIHTEAHAEEDSTEAPETPEKSIRNIDAPQRRS